MSGFSAALRAVNARGNPIMVAGLCLGLAVPQLAHFFRPILEPCVAMLLVSSLLRMRWGAIGQQMRRPAQALALSVFIVILAPLLLWPLCQLLGLPRWLSEVMFLAACAGPIMASPLFAQMLRLDAPLTVAVVVATTLIMPVSLPLLGRYLPGIEFDIPVDAFLLRVSIFIIMPFVLSALAKWLIGTERLERNGQEIGGLTVIMLFFFGMSVMDGAQARLIAAPLDILGLLLAAFALNIFLQLIAIASFSWQGARLALTAAQASGNRNVGLVLGLLGAAAGQDFVLFVAAAQLPMFLTPILLPLVYNRFSPAMAGR